MARIVVVGAGIGGLGTALFCARRGHEVTLVERDADPPAGEAEHDFEHWRRGVPHGRQPHNLLGLTRAVLAEEAPDVLASIHDAGGTRVDMLNSFDGDLEPEPGDEELWTFAIRRTTFEPLLRRAVEAEPSVRIVAGATVEGLLGADGHPPRVHGVLTTEGAFEADVVVDAGGRRSALARWLTDLGARPPIEQVQPLRFAYNTRWFRLPEGSKAPAPIWPPLRPLGCMHALIFPSDARLVSLTFTMSMIDPLRHALRDPEAFDRVALAVPEMRVWLEAGAEPVTGVLAMSGLENRFRSVVDDDSPAVTGVVPVGDAALHTNPTLGRGVSLALRHAQRFAQTVERAIADPAAYAVDFDSWTREHLVPWYESQVRLDQAFLDEIEAHVRGQAPPDDRASRLNAALRAASRRDPVVARALARFQQLTSPARDLFAPEVMERVRSYAEAPSPEVPLPRARFEELVDERVPTGAR